MTTIKAGTRIEVSHVNLDGSIGWEPATKGRRTADMGELPDGYMPVTFDRLYNGKPARLLVHASNIRIASPAAEMTGYESMTTEQILAEIEQLQAVQKGHPPAHKAWQTASELLAPLFQEMAKRQAA